jgi:tetrahydromethanopterin S-methyltransferase subunit G
MFPDKELVKKNLDEFFKSVDEVIKPYFDRFGYKKKILRGRGKILFEKVIGKNLVTIDYSSYVMYNIKGFTIRFSSVHKYLYAIKMDESLSADDPWKYDNEEDLKRLLSESIKKIDGQRLLQTEEER